MERLEPEDKVPLRERPIDEVVAVLQNVLDLSKPGMAAYALGYRDPAQVEAFAQAKAVPDVDTDRRARDLAELIEYWQQDGETDRYIGYLMIGPNPLLGDQAPLEVVHAGESHRLRALIFRERVVSRGAFQLVGE